MNSVLKGTSYVLVHAPDMLVHAGTTQTTERIVNPSSEYLKELPKHLRSFEDAVAYLPNQVYIGNKIPADMSDAGETWYDKPIAKAQRSGKFGEIMSQAEFYMLMYACDAFDLVMLEAKFVSEAKLHFKERAQNEVMSIFDENLCVRDYEGVALSEIENAVKNEQAEGLYHNGKLIGCVKKAHDIDTNLSAGIILENLVSKTSCTLALLHLVKTAGIDKSSIDLVLDCSEEAVGDMNQRGGGNLAKAAAESAGFINASGADIRAFCAAPVHAMIHAAALVASGTHENVVVAAGGSIAKLGMNAKDHIKKGVPVLEDVIGGFAALISANDGISPEILSAYTGKHNVGTGSSPQAVITSLITDPLDKLGIKIADIDKYSVEMQNPDITKPAGAGDVPLANYKMIAALGVKRGEMERTDIDGFTQKHGMPGWAPTQGHIPSGVPYMGFARDDIMSGRIKRSMIVGKGSLFLGRMTNLFDGASFIMQKNDELNAKKKMGKQALKETGAAEKVSIILTGIGSEHGEENMIQGAAMAAARGINVLYAGTKTTDDVTTLRAKDDKKAHEVMERLLKNGEADAAVTMHYNFPIGVSTVGRVVTPALGKAMYIATTTGTSSTNRVEGMVINAIYGIITAKACGVKAPTVGILNVDGARQAEMTLRTLQESGYDIKLASSKRADGGCIFRGNDMLAGECDVLVTDPLTGNILMKTLSSFTTGGSYEALGWGYGPGVGKGWDKLILILSRASGAPVVANAIEFAAQLVRGDFKKVAAAEFSALGQIKVQDILSAARSKETEKDTAKETGGALKVPQKEPVTAEISGIEITDLDDAVAVLWREDIYAQSGMGCTGPVVLVNEGKLKQAEGILAKKKFILQVDD
ncbi:MAG: glycine/sarcosine/betaine reductase complex component C subunit beta [Oscillospiraceae bacterium]|nr:glycine/sarcosine/betaine reductase complex component C subunit beta [Oscillospiraceae bacterium]